MKVLLDYELHLCELSMDRDSSAAIGIEIGQLGKCHICGQHCPIKFCPECDHWFCKPCRKRYFLRGIEFVKQLVGGKRSGCCGPEKLI